MKIILTDHVKKRMKERNITKEDVESIVSLPDYTIKKAGKVEAIKTMDDRTLKVIYSGKKDIIVVISVMQK